jgi:hypothetical protein
MSSNDISSSENEIVHPWAKKRKRIQIPTSKDPKDAWAPIPLKKANLILATGNPEDYASKMCFASERTFLKCKPSNLELSFKITANRTVKFV